MASAPAPPRWFLSPDGSDSNSCSQASPCQTLNHVYHKAKPGDTVALGAGAYDAQTLTADDGKTGPDPVSFLPAPGASVQVAGLTVEGASYVALRGLTFTSPVNVTNQNPGQPGSSNVLFAGDVAPSLRVIGQVSNVSFVGGSYGGVRNEQPQIKKYNPTDPDSSAPSNLLIDRVSFHDFRRTDPSIHTECLQILDGNTISVRRSVFWNCDGTGDIGITPQSPIVNLTMENNFIGGGGDTGYGVQIGSMQRNFVFRYNSSSQSVFFSDSKPGFGPYTFAGNYMPYNFSLCRSGVTYSHNVLRGGTCGPSDGQVDALTFVDAANHDLHLPRGAPVIGKGDPATRPSGDIDGDTRPLRATPDAGADQWDSAALVPGRSIGKIAIGESASDVTGFYGPARTGQVKLAGHVLQRLLYRLHGGRLWALADGGKVVAVGTTSGFYATESGLGVGSRVSGWRGMSWMDCRASFRSRGRVVSVITPRGGSKGRTVAAFALWRRPYLTCP